MQRCKRGSDCNGPQVRQQRPWLQRVLQSQPLRSRGTASFSLGRYEHLRPDVTCAATGYAWACIGDVLTALIPLKIHEAAVQNPGSEFVRSARSDRQSSACTQRLTLPDAGAQNRPDRSGCRRQATSTCTTRRAFTYAVLMRTKVRASATLAAEPRLMVDHTCVGRRRPSPKGVIGPAQTPSW